MQNEEPKLEKDDENVQNVMDMKVSEAEAKATEVVEVVEMDVSVAQPMAEGTPEKAQVVQVVQVAERQNAPDTQSSADAEYMSRIERCHEEAMKKVQVATEEAEESKEKDESNVEDACGRRLGQANTEIYRQRWWIVFLGALRLASIL